MFQKSGVHAVRHCDMTRMLKIIDWLPNIRFLLYLPYSFHLGIRSSREEPIVSRRAAPDGNGFNIETKRKDTTRSKSACSTKSNMYTGDG